MPLKSTTMVESGNGTIIIKIAITYNNTTCQIKKCEYH